MVDFAWLILDALLKLHHIVLWKIFFKMIYSSGLTLHSLNFGLKTDFNLFLCSTVWHMHVFHLCLWRTRWHVLWTRVLQGMLGRVSHNWLCLRSLFFSLWLNLLYWYTSVSFHVWAVLLFQNICECCLRFLNLKIQEGEAHNIFCPAFDCYQLVPVEVIESVVSREMDRRYLQFDIKVLRTR